MRFRATFLIRLTNIKNVPGGSCLKFSCIAIFIIHGIFNIANAFECAYEPNMKNCREKFDYVLHSQAANQINLPYFLKDYCKAWAELSYCVTKANQICGITQGDAESRVRATFLATAPAEMAFCRVYVDTLELNDKPCARAMIQCYFIFYVNQGADQCSLWQSFLECVRVLPDHCPLVRIKKPMVLDRIVNSAGLLAKSRCSSQPNRN